ncbi:MAG: AraC family transcriptional regulator [Eubacteriales bacterium]
MIYKQEAWFLRYDIFPVSSYCYNYSPLHATQPAELKKSGVLWFSTPHNHMAVEILRVVHGQVHAMVNNVPYDMYEGDIVIANPFDVHATYITKADSFNEFHVINFDMSILRNNTNADFDSYIDLIEQNKLNYQTFIPHTHSCSARLNETAQMIHNSYNARNTSVGFMNILSGLYRLCSELEQFGFTHADEDKNRLSQSAFSREIVQYVSKNYDKQITTADAAEHFHYSISYFCRYFKSVFSQTFVEYLNRYRITVAHSLSRDQYHTLEALAEAVGFNTYNLFASCFKKYTGYTPKEYFKPKNITPDKHGQ